MGKLIRVPEDYKNFLIFDFEDEPVGNGTREELNASLEFACDVPLGFCDPVYLKSLWEVISTYAPPGVAPSVNYLSTLDSFVKRKQGWFTGEVASQYGAEIFAQLPKAIAELKRDQYSRKSVIKMSGDKCLQSLQFLIRSVESNGVVLNALAVIATFRSSDAIYGLPADFFIIHKIGEIVSDELEQKIPLMDMIIAMNCASLHVYNKDRNQF